MRIIKKMIEIIRDFSEALLKKFKDYEDEKGKIIDDLKIELSDVQRNAIFLGEAKTKEIADLKAKLSEKTLIEKTVIDRIIKEAEELQEVINMLKNGKTTESIEVTTVKAIVEKVEKDVKEQPDKEIEKKVEEKKAEIVKEIKTITVSTLGAGNIEVPVEPDSAINRVSVRTRRR